MHTTESGRHGRLGTSRKRELPRLRMLYSSHAALDPPREIRLAVGRTKMGREFPDGDGIEIADRRVSRLHAMLQVDSDLNTTIIDEQSKNSTFVNGEPVKKSVKLREGDLLRLGDSFFLLRHEPLVPAEPDFSHFIGYAPGVVALRAAIRRIAKDMATVLILGETGTGKELVARALHRLSGRTGAYMPVNCAAIPETMAESQFFGHVDGAFTDARAHLGFMRAAHLGTLFLDEIGELTASLQPKLLRVLQERAVMPLGALQQISINVRLVAATHQSLEALIHAGRFREDLYARLVGIVLHVPPLRERREDILPLLSYALKAAGGAMPVHDSDSAAGPEIPADVIEALLLCSWPHNVRQVFQIADHLRLLGPNQGLLERLNTPAFKSSPSVSFESSGKLVSPAGSDGPLKPRRPRPGELQMPGREQLVELMSRYKGVIKDVAEVLGCSRRQVGRMLEQLGIDRDAFR